MLQGVPTPRSPQTLADLRQTAARSDRSTQINEIAEALRDRTNPAEMVPRHAPLLDFHGTSSAALFSIARAGLVPSGELLNENRAPFTGELQMGFIDRIGINRDSVSVVSAWGLEHAVQYALEQAQPWSHAENAAQLAEAEAWLASVGSSVTPALGDAAERMIKLLRLRDSQSANLTERERNELSDPFPIVIGVCPHRGMTTKEARSDISSEQGIVGRVASANLVAFVPAPMLARAQALADGHPLRIEPFTELGNYTVDHSRAVKTFLRGLPVFDAARPSDLVALVPKLTDAHKTLFLFTARKISAWCESPDPIIAKEAVSVLRMIASGALTTTPLTSMCLYNLKQFGDRSDLPLFAKAAKENSGAYRYEYPRALIALGNFRERTLGMALYAKNWVVDLFR